MESINLDQLTAATTSTAHGASSASSAATAASAAPSTSATATATATASATATRISKPTHGQQLVRGNVEHIIFLKALGHNPRVGLDGKHDILDGAKDLVDLANLLLVLQIDAGVEVRDLGLAVR